MRIAKLHGLPAAHARHAGFSLIELMIAVLLGALVVAGLINVLIANRQAYHLQESTNFNQQNLRFAMDRIGWSLRMADFWGGIYPSAISGAPAVGGTSGSCNAAFALDVNDAVYGYDGNDAKAGASFPIAGCVSNANYVSGSDVLVVRYADADALPVTGGFGGTPAATNSGQIYLQSRSGVKGILFAGDGTSARPAALPNSQAGTYTYPYAIEMYYLRPCSDPGAGGTCSASSDGGNPIPTLMRMRLDSTGTLINEPVVEGIEQLQFEYGLRNPADATKNPVPIIYKSANDMLATDWPNVVAVRIGYVVRAQTRDTAVPHSLETHSTTAASADFPQRLSDNCEYSITTAGVVTVTNCVNYAAGSTGFKPQQYVRSEMTAVVQVRNTIRQI